MSYELSTESCVEDIKGIKRRYKQAKKDMETLLDLNKRGVIEYRDVDRVIGRHFNQVQYLKQEIAQAKAFKKRTKEIEALTKPLKRNK